MNIKLKNFIKDASERAIKTAAQVAAATIGTATMVGEVNWGTVVSTTILATMLSVLTSVASLNFGEENTASVVNLDKK